MTGWVSIVSVAIGVTLYRSSVGDPGIIDSAIIGGISGAIGGGVTAIYNHYLGKYNTTLMDLIDNFLWFILFCIPGLIAGVVVTNSINESMDGSLQTIIMLLVMAVVSIPLTIRKIKKKAKEKALEESTNAQA